MQRKCLIRDAVLAEEGMIDDAEARWSSIIPRNNAECIEE